MTEATTTTERSAIDRIQSDINMIEELQHQSARALGEAAVAIGCLFDSFDGTARYGLGVDFGPDRKEAQALIAKTLLLVARRTHDAENYLEYCVKRQAADDVVGAAS